MASLEYEQIFSRFRTKTLPYEYLDLSDTQVFEFECNWLRTTFAKPAFRKQFASISLDDDMEELTYTMSHPIDSFTDEEFLIDVASTGMICAWMQPKVYSTTNMAQTYGTTELKFYSEANHMAELAADYEKICVEFKKLIRDRGGYFNSYLRGDV